MLGFAACFLFDYRLVDQGSTVALFAQYIFFLALVAVLWQGHATLLGKIYGHCLWRELAGATQPGREAMTSLCTRCVFSAGGLLAYWVWSYKTGPAKALSCPFHRVHIAGDSPTICRIQWILRHLQSDLPLELSTVIFILKILFVRKEGGGGLVLVYILLLAGHLLKLPMKWLVVVVVETFNVGRVFWEVRDQLWLAHHAVTVLMTLFPRQCLFILALAFFDGFRSVLICFECELFL